MLVGLVAVIVSTAGYLLYITLDRYTLLGVARRSVDVIIGEWGEFNEIGLTSEEVCYFLVMVWSKGGPETAIIL